jgi:hypothetical protein
MDAHNGGLDWRLTMEPGRVYRLVVADSNHFEGQLDSDPD